MRGKTLVVAPTSVLLGWAKEAARFRPGLKVSVYHGPSRQLDASADLTLTTWALLRMDSELLAKVTWETIVLDEAQTIKNPESQVAKAAHRLKASFRMCLSGTPIENRLNDLWSQMAFLEPGFLGAKAAFEERYVGPISSGDALRAQELRSRIRPFLLRRMKRDVAPDLPPRTEMVERCELGPDERLLYDALRAAAQKEVQEDLAKGGSVLHALELLLRLRQAACHRGLVPGQVDAASSAKVELLMELLDELLAEGHKVLVFSQWTSLLDRVEPHLEKAKMGYLRLDGSTTDRQSVVDGFQSESGPPVLLLSLKAGGTGLTLTAADHVVLLDPWWNPAVEDQAADRAHRIGQDKPVFVHRLVAADTVEDRILALQESKRRLAEAALGQGAGGAGLTREDLMALLA
jgi:SNF2 family DNA or RNA helicase